MADSLSGQTVVYDPNAGAYTLVNGKDLISGDAFSGPGEGSGEAVADVTASEKEGFKIGPGFGRTLTNDEKGGFLLLVGIGGCGLLILGYVYFFIVRKRKDE